MIKSPVPSVERGESVLAELGCVQERFQWHARRQPEQAALAFGDQVMTYGRLNRRANSLAHRLLAAGARPDMLIGLQADRGFEMIVGILGILKTGAAYLPLNPRYPRARLRLMMEDSGASLLVSERALAATVPAISDAVLEIDPDAEDSSDPSCAVDTENLAYSLYTSGSTGTPKGVLVPHRGLCPLIDFTARQMDISSDDRVLQFAEFSFDISIWEIFTALAHGATLILARRDDLTPGPALHELIQRQRTTVLTLSASVLQILPPHGLDCVRLVIAVAEKCTREAVRRWAPGRRFFNAYGPTETTIFSTIAEINANDDGDPIIGAPVPGTDCIVLGSSGQRVSPGESGELLIGGKGVSRGYINRPELTTEKFVHLSVGGKGRYYRTGDLARFRSDGALEYLCRIDHQLKIRGFRIEPGEIENCLERHPDIASCAVVARIDPGGRANLVAFFLTSAGASVPTCKELATHLSQTLPEYMVPAVFIQQEKWPLTPNGKLDRGALLASLTLSGNEPESLYSGSSAEMRLRDLCQRVIGASPVRLDERLLEIGLHSLSAASLVWLIQEEFHVQLRLSDVLDDPTIAKLLTLIEDGSRTEPDSARSINVQPHPESLPLSFAQEQVWFLEKLHPRLNSYRFQALFNCIGALNVSVLEASLNRVVSRHAILRTAFVAQEGGTPRQEVRSHVPFTLPHEDLRAFPEEARQQELQHRIEEELRRPFHLGDPPLIRWRLYQLGDEKYSLLHTEHHFVHDGWSYGVFLDELYATYAALVRGESLANEPAPIQFADFALWQRQMFTSGAWDHQLDYWRKQLVDCPPPPQLPSDRHLGLHRNFEGLQIRHPIPEALWTELRQACSREGVTRFAWIQAVFHLFIHLYTGADDFCTGTGFANRRDPRFHKMLGMAINTLPIRAHFEGIATFHDLLRRTQDRLRFALDNQELPFEIVVKDLNPGRDANTNPLFNAFVACYDAAYSTFADQRLEISSEDLISCGQVKFDLVALLIPGRHAEHPSPELSVPLLIWEFSTELFDFSTGKRMLDHFLGLLESSIRQPDAPVGSLSMARHDEVNQVLAFGRGRESPPQCETPLHRLFESVVAAAPNAPAVVTDETSLTYGELNLRANNLARRLACRGFTEGSIAAVALPRGPEAIVCFLAVLKAGGAYLPIDLRDPGDRIACLLRLAKVQIVLTLSSLAASLPASVAKAEVCFIDESFVGDERDLSISVSASSPAYVLFTSGSTGIPKGVVVPHRAVSRLVFGLPAVQLDSSEVLLHLAPLSFDASTFEIWGALLHGAKLVISCEDLPDFRSLEETILRHGITTTWLTSSLFNQIIDTSPENLRGLRQILTGGEALSPNHVRRALDLIPGARIINGYGPTEATTFATVYQVPRSFGEASTSVPIGRPLAGTQAYVLSDRRRLVSGEVHGESSEDEDHGPLRPLPQLAPIGVPGELYIGGEGVALGYLNLPELTAERFLADSFAKLPGGRLYKTGDLVRWRPDGNLDFLGRIDGQVKIRGFRIEPGEIEAVLEQHPSVGCAVVRMWEPAPGEKQLAAYYEARDKKSLEAADLLDLLGSQLPRYMIPATLLRVEKLPLTAAGKVNWRALPRPDTDRPQVTETYLAPRNAIEKQLASIWSRLLNVERIGIHDNFFELGGHSLIATRVVSQIRREFDVEIPLRAIFESSTIEGLAPQIARRLSNSIAPGEIEELLSELESLPEESAAYFLAEKTQQSAL